MSCYRQRMKNLADDGSGGRTRPRLARAAHLSSGVPRRRAAVSTAHTEHTLAKVMCLTNDLWIGLAAGHESRSSQAATSPSLRLRQSLLADGSLQVSCAAMWYARLIAACPCQSCAPSCDCLLVDCQLTRACANTANRSSSTAHCLRARLVWSSAAPPHRCHCGIVAWRSAVHTAGPR